MAKVRRIAPPGMKWCPTCQKFHLRSEFIGGYCKTCYRGYHRDWVHTHRPRLVGKLRAEALAHYGGKCRDCGADDPAVLTFQPSRGQGQRELLYALRREGYPADNYILCYNCLVRQEKEVPHE